MNIPTKNAFPHCVHPVCTVRGVCLALAFLLSLISSHSLTAQTEDPWRVEAGITFSHFQQQIKQEIGGERGERLVNETSVGMLITGSHDIFRWLSAGLYVRMDAGERTAARFSTFDSLGRAQTTGMLGGSFTEFWTGPFVRASWKSLSAELGYGALGIRSDNGRSDLPSTSGDTTAAFTTSPAVAWMAGLGATVPVNQDLDVFIRAEYRVRYYIERNGEDILDGAEHGTQSFTPIIGIGYRW